MFITIKSFFSVEGAHSPLLPVTRNIPWIEASELPVNVAQDFIRKFGFVKPSDADILNYADTIGLTDIDVASGLRSLYTDPAMVLLEDDSKNVVALYADTGMNMINAYPETRDTFHSLLDASNAVALVYRPERFLLPSETNAVASRFFVPRNFKISNAVVNSPEKFAVFDAPIVLRKLEIPAVHPRDRALPYFRLFDIEKIPYAYKSPVHLRVSDAASPVWYKAIVDSDVYPISHDVTYPVLKTPHVAATDAVTPLAVKSLCQRNPFLCAKYTKVAADIDVPSPILKRLPHVTETDPRFYTVLDTTYPVLKSANTFASDFSTLSGSNAFCARHPFACTNYATLRGADKFSANPVPYDSEYLTPLKFQPVTEHRVLKTIPSAVPHASNPALPLLPSKNIPYASPSFVTIPAVDNILAKTLPASDILTPSHAEATVIPEHSAYFIRPEHLKAATVPVLSVAEHKVAPSTIINPLAPVPTTTLAEN